MELIIQPFSKQALGDYIKELLGGNATFYHSFQAAVAFAKFSGVQHIIEELKLFSEHGGYIRIVIGIDQHGSSWEAFKALLDATHGKGEIWINHDEAQYLTFHPKVYFFEGRDTALLIIGSGNLTQGGLYSNDEASAAYHLDFSNKFDYDILLQIKSALDGWCDPLSGTANQLNFEFLDNLVAEGYVKKEADLKPEISDEANIGSENVDAGQEWERKSKKHLFGHRIGRKRPPKRAARDRVKIVAQPFEEQAIIPVNGYVMTLMRTDVGFGQLTPGTSRRSPEVFIPLKARNAFSEFWKWPDQFVEDSERAGKFDRSGVRMRLGGKIISVNMMTWPVKSDFRLRSEALRSAGQIGDILRIERVEETAGYEYYVEIVPKGTSDYDHYNSLCVNKTSANSKRMWGYYRITETED